MITRSVLDCGGKSDATPLSHAGRFSNRRQPSSARKLRRRCALPEQSKTWRHLAASLVFLAAVLTARAQYSIDWFTIDGGGGTSTGGVYAVSGTIGQPDAGGPMTNGQYAVTGGFWALPIAVQTVGAPQLSIERIGGAVRVFWPKPSTGFVLDQSLTVTGTWSQVSFPYATNATDISITVPAPAGNKFHRLRSP